MKNYFDTVKQKKTGKFPKPVYQFDIEGTFIYKHKNIKTASENLFISESAIQSALTRKSFCKKQWYFSYTKDFIRPVSHNNPLLGGSKKYLDMDLTDDDDIL